mmetsp:Transcript_50830/g.75328  ORF Transcript_50830/g.75328 Transcript_50830/m.75328 type:complete len:438 (+) Transcript_50830:3-1316(+)
MLCFGGAGLRSYCWEKGARGGASQVKCDWDSGSGTRIADVMPHPKKEGIYQACLINKTHVSIWRIDTAAAELLGPNNNDSSDSEEGASRPSTSSSARRSSASRHRSDSDKTIGRQVDATVRATSASEKRDGARSDSKLGDSSDDDDDDEFDESKAATPRRVATDQRERRPISAVRPRTSDRTATRRPLSVQKGRATSPVRRGSSRGGTGTAFIPAHRSAPVGLNYASFLSANLSAYNHSEAAHKRAVSKILTNYEQHLSAFEDRLDVAAKTAAIWKAAGGSISKVLAYFSRSNGGPAGSSAIVLAPAEVDVFVAIMRRVRLRSSGMALKDLTTLVPLLTDVVRNTDRNDGFQLTAVLMLTQLVDMFAGVIKQTIRGGRTPAARRDVVFAERLDKVSDVVDKLESLNGVVQKVGSAKGLVGFHARYLTKQLAPILSST